MLNISDAAVEKAKEILTTEGKADWGLKFFCQGSSCCGPSFGMDIQQGPTEDDQTMEKDGLKIYADTYTVESMKGMMVDFINENGQQGFVIKSTGEGGGCSCADGTCP